MTIHEATIAKIQQMPEPLAQEVLDYIDFLLTRSNSIRWQIWQQFSEASELAESDLPDYLSNLEDYEKQLARGEVKW
jgi:Protein of unknown function (DUF2281)